MKLTKELESEIKQVMEDYWASYFKGDLVTWSHFLPDEYRNIGSTEEEVWNSKEEMLEYSKAVVPFMVGNVEIRNKRLEIIPLEPYFMVHEFVDMFINTGGKWVFYSKFRLSSLIQKTDAGWKVIHQHGSVPDSKAQEGESIGFQKISKENLELREAVKRRTVELEYKNHELEVETSLERVRTVAMSMKKPNDLLNIGEMLFRELKILGFSELRNALINTFVDEENYFTDYDYSDLTGGSITRIPYSGHPVIENYIRNLRKDNDAFTEQIVTGKELEQWKEFRRSNGEADDPRLDNIAAVYYYVYSVGAGGIGISTLSSISEEKLKVLKRFSNVFDLAYKRYTDITKAEAQSREAQVELALERVRARTMAMQRSDELADVATILFQQVKALGVPQWSCGFSIWEIGDKEFTWYQGSPDGDILPPCKIPLTEHPVFISMDESRRRGDELFVYEKEGEFQADHYRYMQSIPGLQELLQNSLDAGLSFPTFQIDHLANFSHGNLAFITYEHFPEMHDIFKRFAKVFDQTYTRFLDLQKAEAQAREAKIENALEKVRSRSLAMHKSDELEEVVHTVFDKLKALEVELYTAIIFIFAEGSKDIIWWLENKVSQHYARMLVPYDDNPYLKDIFETREKGNDFFSATYSLKEKNELFHHLFENTDFKYVPEKQKQFLLESELATMSVAIAKNTGISITSYTKKAFSENENEILRRFGKVFEQAYTRFLDLQKAEAQAREAQIEAALERVRSRTMGMQKSIELGEVSHVISEQLQQLNFKNYVAGFLMDFRDSDDFNVCRSDTSGLLLEKTSIPYFDHPMFNRFLLAKETGLDFYDVCLTFEEKNKWVDHALPFFQEAPQAVKEFLYSSAGYAFSCALLKNVGLFIENFDGIAFSKEENDILMRFGKVFEQTYIRFLDLQKAEVQAREARVEAALEKVRSKTMAMHHSPELQYVIEETTNQLHHLGFKADSTNFLIKHDIHKDPDMHLWLGVSGSLGYYKKIIVPYFDHPMFSRTYEAMDKGKELITDTFSQEEKNIFYRYIYEHTVLKDIPEERKNYVLNSKGMARSTVISKNSALTIINYDCTSFTPEENGILKRMAHVFDQAYTRFRDLEKAEAQAREAQIEVSLERVRSKAMAMQKSEDLADAVAIVFGELDKLNLGMLRCGIGILNKEKRSADLWTTTKSDDDTVVQVSGDESMDIHPLLHGAFEAWLKQEDHSYVLKGEDLNNYYKALTGVNFKLPDSQSLVTGAEGVQQYYFNAVFSSGGLFAFRETEFPEEAKIILKRFADVFHLTYTRFNDLKQAEAQGREAQIELGLERVRARAMAMQNSEELAELVATVFNELIKLDFALTHCFIWIFDTVTLSGRIWQANLQTPNKPLCSYIKYHEHPAYLAILKAWEQRDSRWMYELKGSEKRSWDDFLFTETEYINLPQVVKDGMRNLDRVLFSASFNNFGALQTAGVEPLSDEQMDILFRFGKVFDLTYTRFNDLKQAEAQAREAQFQLSLERVRARTMAMHHSNELAETSSVLFQQIKELDFETWSCGFCIWTKNDQAEVWMGADSGGLLPPMMIPYKEEPTHRDIYEASLRGALAHEKVWEGEALAEHYAFLKTIPSVREAIEILESSGLTLPARQCYYVGFFKQGYLLLITKEPNEDLKELSKRFAQVFDLTYTRFLDLQKAEIQAREATIEGALERVRSRTLAMQKSDELAETAAVLFRQLILLGIAPNRLYICIVNDDSGQIEFWVTDEDGSRISKQFTGDANRNASMKKIHDVWKEGKKSLTIDMQGEELQNYFHYLADELHVPFTVGLTQKRRIQSIGYFSRGFIGIASPDEQPAETISLLERFASVFNLTYTRFNDLKIAEAHAEQAELDLLKLKEEKKRTEDALAELQVTQKQLIQAEKMASLGELTAGIAHEIQNPLNFVNNFSEVNRELVDELAQEIDKGNYTDAKAIAKDIKDNEEKISHHGKRADAIVKGMLQHSRSSSGQKEATNVNTLADEYLRLAYHGLRAKDKTFNATLKTDYDETIGNINIIPQDIGRVILNLITNAFYAVAEKSKLGIEGYEPTVSISTKRMGDIISIAVKDNGNGIPQQALDKIFQPFFTTKPAGQGTGLGLSLAYDIVKAHGGEFQLETKEGEGSAFAITLPKKPLE